MRDSGNGIIKIYRPEDFVPMRRAGHLAALTLDMIAAHIRPGIKTAELDAICHQFITDHGAISAPLNYRGFPKATCISVNHVVCHGIPGDRILQEGDIANIDITVILDGWHGDSSRMYAVGRIARKAQRLIAVTKQSLAYAIAAAGPGKTTGDIGYAIERYAISQRCSVVRDFCGHGIGRGFHEPPSIMHFGIPGEGYRLRPGMFFTIEPMLNLGKAAVTMLDDGWTAVTRDFSLSAQFEHTVGITEDGVEIFTLGARELAGSA